MGLKGWLRTVIAIQQVQLIGTVKIRRKGKGCELCSEDDCLFTLEDAQRSPFLVQLQAKHVESFIQQRSRDADGLRPGVQLVLQT